MKNITAFLIFMVCSAFAWVGYKVITKLPEPELDEYENEMAG